MISVQEQLFKYICSLIFISNLCIFKYNTVLELHPSTRLCDFASLDTWPS